MIVAEFSHIVIPWRHHWLETAIQNDENEYLLEKACETFFDKSCIASAGDRKVRSNTNVIPKNNNIKIFEVAVARVGKCLMAIVSWCLQPAVPASCMY